MDRDSKDAIKKEFQLHDSDSGSSAIQIALLSKRIEDLTGHLKSHRKDHSSRHGLIKMVSQRRKLLDYLKSKDEASYKGLIKRLKLRH